MCNNNIMVLDLILEHLRQVSTIYILNIKDISISLIAVSSLIIINQILYLYYHNIIYQIY